MDERIRYPKYMTHKEQKSEFQKRMNRDGWSERNIVGNERASELKELYEESGFEVMLVPVNVNGGGLACDGCYDNFEKVPDVFQVIYTREAKKKQKVSDSR